MSEREKLIVLMHEIAHVLIKRSGRAENITFTEEDFCDIIGYGLTEILFQNPWLLKLLLRKNLT